MECRTAKANLAPSGTRLALVAPNEMRYVGRMRVRSLRGLFVHPSPAHRAQGFAHSEVHTCASVDKARELSVDNS